MADFVNVATQTGPKVDTEEFIRGADTIYRQRVIVANCTTIKSTVATVASIAAGASGDLDSDQISSGKTGKLIQLTVSASVPFKAEIKTVLNGSPSSTIITHFSGFNRFWDFSVKDPDFITVTQDPTIGLDGFRITVTNLDTSEAADVHATFFYDET